MIVVDTSAIVAALAPEPDAALLIDALIRAPERLLSAVNAFECRVVLMQKFGSHKVAEFDLLTARLPVKIVPFDSDQAVLAESAYRRFGKGTGHPARLNLGDCAAYALATSRGCELLFKGLDFTRTDIIQALRRE